MRTVNRLAFALALAATCACDRDGPLDAVADIRVDAGVWRADGEQIARALPKHVGAYVPVEASDPFFTTFPTGPVFGASCTYADGPRQLVVRVEAGNIRARATAALDAHAPPPPGSSPAVAKRVGHEATVHGRSAAVRWSETGRVGEVSFVVARRYLVQTRLVPAASEAEALAAAESVDVTPLESLALQGLSP